MDQLNQGQTIIVLPYATESDILKAEKIQRELYNHFNSVKVYPSGILKIKIVADQLINSK